jgi:hypothetical protein
MKDDLQEFLARSLPLPGVGACSVRLVDRTYVTRCDGDSLTTAQVEKTLGRLALAADGLGYHGIQPERLCWVFEHSRIHLALRRDGACLALFVENRPGAGDGKVEDLLEEFRRLPSLPATGKAQASWLGEGGPSAAAPCIDRPLPFV